KVGLVNESSRLQGIARRLGGQAGGSEAAQLVVDQRQKSSRRLWVALVHCVQELRDFSHVVSRAEEVSERNILFQIEIKSLSWSLEICREPLQTAPKPKSPACRGPTRRRTRG